MSLKKFIASLAFSAFMAACGGGGGPPVDARLSTPGQQRITGGPAGSSPDAGVTDPPPVDAAPAPDAAGVPDAGMAIADAGEGSTDAGPVADAAMPDATAPDAAPPPPPAWHRTTVRGFVGTQEVTPCDNDPGSSNGGFPVWKTATVACDAAHLGLAVAVLGSTGKLRLAAPAQGTTVSLLPNGVLSVYGATGCTDEPEAAADAPGWVCQ